MTRSEHQRLRHKIDEDLDLLCKELAALESQLKPIAPDCSLGDILRSEMMHNQEVLNRSYVAAKKRYNKLIYARAHLDDERYGYCDDCDEPIAFERLLLMPESKYCIQCAKERML